MPLVGVIQLMPFSGWENYGSGPWFKGWMSYKLFVEFLILLMHLMTISSTLDAGLSWFFMEQQKKKYHWTHTDILYFNEHPQEQCVIYVLFAQPKELQGSTHLVSTYRFKHGKVILFLSQNGDGEKKRVIFSRQYIPWKPQHHIYCWKSCSAVAVEAVGMLVTVQKLVYNFTFIYMS